MKMECDMNPGRLIEGTPTGVGVRRELAEIIGHSVDVRVGPDVRGWGMKMEGGMNPQWGLRFGG